MKTSKAEAHEKGSKKAAKKELQKNLTNKFIEAVKSLGHDAATIGEDLVLVSKFVAKKISKKMSGGKKDAGKKAAEVVAHVAPTHKKGAVKKAEKAVKKANKSAEKDISKAKTVVNSVQVTGMASEEKLKQVLSKPDTSANGKRTKSKPTILKPTATKLDSKKDGAATD
jgi:uncharacterized protein YkwD